MLFRAAAFAALGGFLFGYDHGLISGALLGMSEELGITQTWVQECVVGALKFGGFFGVFLGGAAMLRYGRRPTIASTSITALAGPIIMATAAGPGAIVVGRLIMGIGIGVCTSAVPTFLAEIAPAAQRGAVVEMYELLLTVGTLSAVVVDWALGDRWRVMVGLPAIPGAIMALALLVLPESPRWLVMRNDMDKALETLHKIMRGQRGGCLDGILTKAVPDHQALSRAEDELLLLWSSVQKDNAVVKERQQAVRARRRADRAERLTAAAGAAMPVQGETAAGSHQAGSHAASPQQQGWFQKLRGGSRSSAGGGAYRAPLHPSSGSILPVVKPAGGGLLRHTAASSSGPTQEEPLLSTTSHSLSSAAALDPWPSAARRRSSTELPGGTQRQHSLSYYDSSQQHHQPQGSYQHPEYQHPQLDGGAYAAPQGVHGNMAVSPAGQVGVHQAQPIPLPPQAPLPPPPAPEPPPLHTSLIQPQRPDQVQGAHNTLGPFTLEDLEEQGTGHQEQEHHHLIHPGMHQAQNLHLSQVWEHTGQYPGGDASTSGASGMVGSQGTLPQSTAAGHEGEPAHSGWQAQQGQQQQQGQGGGGDHQLKAGQVPGGTSGSGSVAPGEERFFWTTFWNMLIDIAAVAQGEEGRALRIIAVLAILNQATASTAVISYAPTLFQRIGGTEMTTGMATGFTIGIAVTKVVSVSIGLLLVDIVGRRPLLVWGAAGCAASMILAAVAAAAESVPAVLFCLCTFILSFCISWAGTYWVLVSEIFSMPAKSPATSAANGLLFLSGAATNLVFLGLVDLLGAPLTFLIFASVAAVAAVYVWRVLPETRGRALDEVQALLAGKPPARLMDASSGGGASSTGGGLQRLQSA